MGGGFARPGRARRRAPRGRGGEPSGRREPARREPLPLGGRRGPPRPGQPGSGGGSARQGAGRVPGRARRHGRRPPADPAPGDGADPSLGQAKEAVTLHDPPRHAQRPRHGVRRLLAQALILAGRPGEACRSWRPPARWRRTTSRRSSCSRGEPEVKKLAAAEELFAELARKRPIAATHVLIGRTWRDYNEHARARAELKKALALDPRARRAHYDLGMVAATRAWPGSTRRSRSSGGAGDRARRPAANLSLGLAFVEARRSRRRSRRSRRAALAAAACERLPVPGARARGARAAGGGETAARRARSSSRATGREDSQLRNVQYQLGLAYAGSGRPSRRPRTSPRRSA